MTESVDFARLTTREREVLDAMVHTDGTSRAIGEYLGMAAGTVSAHFSTIMLKTDVHSRVALAVAWSRQGEAA